MTRYNLVRKFLCFGLLGVFILTFLIRLIIPKLEFKTEQLNRIFGIVFSLLSILMFILLYFEINKIKNKISKTILLIFNSIFLFVAIISLPMYIGRIDPEIQYYDECVLAINPKKQSEKIIRQYYIDWKPNVKIYSNNFVKEVGCFRYINPNWIGTDTTNWVKQQAPLR